MKNLLLLIIILFSFSCENNFTVDEEKEKIIFTENFKNLENWNVNDTLIYSYRTSDSILYVGKNKHPRYRINMSLNEYSKINAYIKKEFLFNRYNAELKIILRHKSNEQFQINIIDEYEIRNYNFTGNGSLQEIDIKFDVFSKFNIEIKTLENDLSQHLELKVMILEY